MTHMSHISTKSNVTTNTTEMTFLVQLFPLLENKNLLP